MNSATGTKKNSNRHKLPSASPRAAIRKAPRTCSPYWKPSARCTWRRMSVCNCGWRACRRALRCTRHWVGAGRCTERHARNDNPTTTIVRRRASRTAFPRRSVRNDNLNSVLKLCVNLHEQIIIPTTVPKLCVGLREQLIIVRRSASSCDAERRELHSHAGA
ncbi:Unknown protein sequence [Pseudomonas syringae pv. aceris]|uniref:Uncharacterized protein n=1 Tax=Pseudomonas syringae pv. aceris TaxID=199198 RepID=A0A0P9J8U3_PSESX|nr:Unknown protein sequence [Pseudomonas syringae pv. aceris]